jgi:amidophosphoribosyltransferase
MSGLFGTVSRGDCVSTLFYGVDYHSHLGTEYGGMAVFGDSFSRQIHSIAQSQFKSKFFDDYRQMKGNKGIGVISDSDEQPIYVDCAFGPFCLVMAGLIDNKQQLVERMFSEGDCFTELCRDGVNQIELVGRLISHGKNVVDGIQKMFAAIEGSCSVLVLTKDGIYAARDRFGYTPLVLGRKKDAYAVATESSPLPNLGFTVERFLKPGEIILINEDGPVVKDPGKDVMQVCSFLWIYTGFPSSDYEGINVEMTRERCGQALARKDKDIKADYVAGVPDSGTSHAIGYGMEAKLPHRRPLIKYTPGYGRSYTPPDQTKRNLIATMKLVPNKDIIKGQRIVVCDDSIVRGTQLKNFTVKKLWDAGAKEVHVRPACPPLLFPCRFCLSTRTTGELIARKAIREIEGKDIEDISAYLDSSSPKYKKMIAWIQKDMDVTTLRYQTIEDMIAAIGLPKEKLCLYCWTGQAPEGILPGKKGHA